MSIRRQPQCNMDSWKPLVIRALHQIDVSYLILMLQLDSPAGIFLCYEGRATQIAMVTMVAVPTGYKVRSYIMCTWDAWHLLTSTLGRMRPRASVQ